MLTVQYMPEVQEYSNMNLKDIVTPVNVQQYAKLLEEANYDKDKTNYLVRGFTIGFSLEYKGPKKVQMKSRNLPLNVGNKYELWNKVMAEVKANRYAGPFEQIPFKYYIQSPIGLVPKDKGRKTRLIFHLSHPKSGESVNAGIPDDICSVTYPDFIDAVKVCMTAGRGCYCAKSDMSMTFRNVPMDRKS